VSVGETRVELLVAGYTVAGPTLDRAELLEVAHELRSDIGSRLATLGYSCTHGGVSLNVGGVTVTTDDDDADLEGAGDD
jgi:hypothetical protein